MLVLSRYRDESIMIGDNASITIVDIRGDKVRLGIDAPREIEVHRQEVFNAIVRQGKAAIDPFNTAAQNENSGSMLVLSRHRDETILLGNDVSITIVDIRGDKVRLGIDAPKDIPVHRQEVYDAIKRENAKAAQSTPDALGNGPNN